MGQAFPAAYTALHSDFDEFGNDDDLRKSIR